MPLQRLMHISRVLTYCSHSNLTTKSTTQQIYKCRFISVDKPKQTKALKNEKEKVRMYIVQRYIDYVKNYTTVLENRFPTAVKMYRVFSIGIKDFLRDLKTYISLRMRITKDKGFSNMSREDIELYHRMPSDMFRIAPVLILSAIPFGNYIIFPLAFLKPKLLLCSHFWSIQQRIEFSRQDLTERLRNNKPVFRALQAKLDELPESELKERWRHVLGLLGSGVHPTPGELLECKQLFTEKPYELSYLTYAHMGHLLKMHGFKKNVFRKKKLKYIADQRNFTYSFGKEHNTPPAYACPTQRNQCAESRTVSHKYRWYSHNDVHTYEPHTQALCCALKT
ncbi:LETM1-like protein domain-containing protein [Phthorimaea operculella]|nr:LETM1-like protein domain-containing protein [Phthorimaea operculella]